MERKVYDQLVEKIYDSVLDAAHWDGALDSIRLAYNSTAAGFFTQSAQNYLLNYYIRGIDPNEVDVYTRHFSKINPWFTEPGLMQPGRVLTDQTLDGIHKTNKYFVGTEFYQEWFCSQEFRHGMGGNLLDHEGNRLNFTFFRPRHNGYYSPDEIKSYQMLSQHLIKAVSINTKLESLLRSKNAHEEILDRLSLGIMMVDQHRRITYQNPYAQRIFNTEHFTSEPIEAAIRQGFKYRKSTLVSLSRQRKKSLSVCVIPGHEQRSIFDLLQPVVYLVITDPEDMEVSNGEIIARRWHLTDLEARIALQLLHGKSLKEIAETLELTLNTVQWYNKQIMHKVGVRRQAELCLLLTKDSILTHL